MSISRWRGQAQRRAARLVDPLVAWLARRGATPDGLTVAGLALSGLAAALLAGGMPRSAGVIWLFGSAFDMLDGALARATDTVRRAGAFLDSSLDRIGEGLLLTAAVYHFAAQGLALAAALAAWALLASLMVSYTRARAEALGTACTNGVATRVERVILLGLGLLSGYLAVAIVLLALLASVTTWQRLFAVRGALSGDDPTARRAASRSHR